MLARLRLTSTRHRRGARGLKTMVAEQAYPVTVPSKTLARARIAEIDAQKGVSPFLVDTFSRQHDYLRISLTERCNLRCFYCMPSEGVELSPAGHLLTDDEVVRLASLFVRNGVKKIRLTGGEPTVRKGLAGIIARLNELRKDGLQSIGMTTNGIALHRRLPEFVKNGLTHINISLDTLDPFKFEIMTRRLGHEAVLRSLEAALNSTMRSVKLNVVVIRGLNDSEVLDFVALSKKKALSVRFIEFMPFTGNKWDKQKMVPSSELLSRIALRYPGVTKASDELNDTARNYFIPGHRGSIGFISSMSDHFCGDCNRLRLTADGQIKVCLFDPKEISLRDQMRQGASDAEILRTIGLAVQGKLAKHAGMEAIDTVTNRPMILIGAPSHRNMTSKRFRPHPYMPFSHLNPPTSVRRPVYRNFSASARTRDSSSRLTHIDGSGRPAMVNVSSKEVTRRTATARGRIYIPKVAYELVTNPTSPITVAEQASVPSPLEQAKAKSAAKGDVLTVAQLAAVLGCKQTSNLIPLCHPLQLSHISVTLHTEDSHQHKSDALVMEQRYGESPSDALSRYSIVCLASVICEGKTGVEMEALTAASVGLLTVWDMLKAVAGKEMVIGDIFVSEKTGGKSEDFVRRTP